MWTMFGGVVGMATVKRCCAPATVGATNNAAANAAGKMREAVMSVILPGCLSIQLRQAIVVL
jgi:hypothetical protein